MKRTLTLSLSLFALANTLTVSQANAIDWQNVKKNAITGLKIAGGVAVVAAIVYMINQKWNSEIQATTEAKNRIMGMEIEAQKEQILRAILINGRKLVIDK